MENHKNRVAIIEDEIPIGEMIAEFCQGLGFDTLLLSDQEDIVERIKSYAPDLITLDLIMPNFSGLEILEKLKKNEQTSSIPIIVISAIANNEFVEKFLKDRTNGVLNKPFKTSRLKEIIETALSIASPSH